MTSLNLHRTQKPQDDEGQHAESAEDFEDQLAEHASVEITAEDVAEHRFRVTGKQPPHRLYRPVGATGGEWTGQAQAAVQRLIAEEKASVANMKKCQSCGLHQAHDEQVCGFCQELNPAHEVQQEFVVAIKALSKKSDWLQEVLSGAQQVLVDELALGVAGDAGANFSWLEDLRRDVRWLQRQAQNNMNETKAVLKASAAETKEATVQETEALQTYLVGNWEQAGLGREGTLDAANW